MTDTRTPRPYERKVTPYERLFRRSPFSTVTLVAHISGCVPEDALEHAVAAVQRRHTNLRVRIVEDAAGNPWFTSAGVGEIPVRVVPRESGDHWISVVREAAQVPYEFGSCPSIRLILVRSEDQSDLVIACHHIICDGLSLAYLARDLMLHLGDPSREVEVLPDPPIVARDNIPADVSVNAVVRFLINRMNGKWAPQRVRFDQQDYEDLCAAYWRRYEHRLLPIEVPEGQTSALVKRCRSEGVTVNSALTAAFVGAQVEVQGRRDHHSDIAVAGSLRDRLREPVGEAMGFYAGVVRTKHRYDPRRRFWDNARSLHRELRPQYTDRNLFADALMWSYLDPTILEAINFKRLGGLVPETAARYAKLSGFGNRSDVVRSLLKRERMDSLETIAMGTAMTNLTRMDFPRQYGALELERLILKPGGAFPLANVNLVVGAVTCAGKLSLALEFVEANVSMPAAERIGDQALSFLQAG
jgi:hypothetical protein